MSPVDPIHPDRLPGITYTDGDHHEMPMEQAMAAGFYLPYHSDLHDHQAHVYVKVTIDRRLREGPRPSNELRVEKIENELVANLFHLLSHVYGLTEESIEEKHEIQFEPKNLLRHMIHEIDRIAPAVKNDALRQETGELLRHLARVYSLASSRPSYSLNRNNAAEANAGDDHKQQIYFSNVADGLTQAADSIVKGAPFDALNQVVKGMLRGYEEPSQHSKT